MLLQHTVSRQAQRRPDATAIVAGKHSITYGELEESSNRLAYLLRDAGCQKGDRVGLLSPKSIPTLVAMLATLKAECVYVPMDTASPAPRLAKIVEVAEPRCILASGAQALTLLSTLASDQPLPRVGLLDATQSAESTFQPSFTWTDLASAPSTVLDVDTKSDDAAHILFTSGSTGVPKGVVITHSNVMHFIKWATSYFQTNESDRISCHPPLHFDLSTYDIWGTFLAGAALYLVPPEMNLLPHQLAEFIRRNQLTQWFSVPSVLKYMAQFDVVRSNDFPSLKRLLWCGEALPTPTLIYWMKRLPGITFTNLYGPTETTIASSYYTVPSCPKSEQAEIPIGVGCDGEELAVLDEELKPVGTGEIGFLYIRGVGLSPGYWRDSEKTQSAFLPDPQGGRIYNTGDLAKMDDAGLVYCLGRADSQIKSRGYRIELGEVETALNALGLLRECAVVAVKTDGFEGTAICCAYVLPAGSDLGPSDLRQRITEVLPAYMTPSQWKAFEALPLNANGKIDRPRLREHFLAAKSVA